MTINKSADYYEPLFRARVIRAMKALRASITIKDLTIAIAHKNPHLINVVALKKPLTPAANVIRDAMRQGGKIGAEKVRKL